MLVRLRVGCFGGPITGKSGERTKEVYAYYYRVHLEEGQNLRSMKLPVGAYRTETSAAVVRGFY